jgi:hypothetical protein
MPTDLEHAVGVRLLDRSAQGVEPTIYGDALLKRSVAVFDELKQSIRDIEFLSDATTGEGCGIVCRQAGGPDGARAEAQHERRRKKTHRRGALAGATGGLQLRHFGYPATKTRPVKERLTGRKRRGIRA